MKKLLVTLLLLSSYAYAGSVTVDTITHKNGLVSSYFTSSFGPEGNLIVNCQASTYTYGDMSGESIDRPDTLSFSPLASANPDENLAFSMLCETEE